MVVDRCVCPREAGTAFQAALFFRWAASSAIFSEMDCGTCR
jgi:hypothetical protein